MRIDNDGNIAKVNEGGELVTRAVTEDNLLRSSILRGDAYTWFSTNADIDAGDTMLYVRNDSALPLVIYEIVFNGSNVICLWNVGIGSETTTPAGSAVTGVNMNQSFSSRLAPATAFHDETAVTDASVLMEVYTPVTNTVVKKMTGVVLGLNHYIQINQETESTSGSVVVVGHYENPS